MFKSSIKFIRGSSRWETITEGILFNYQNICADAVQHSCEAFVPLRRSFCTKVTNFWSRFTAKPLLHFVFKANLKLWTLKNTGWAGGCLVHKLSMLAFRYNQEQSWEMGGKKLIWRKKRNPSKEINLSKPKLFAVSAHPAQAGRWHFTTPLSQCLQTSHSYS